VQTIPLPDGHIVPVQLHTPLLHVPPCGQAAAQLPQWDGSLDGFVHVAPHITLPVGHVQTPFTHD
jgi:hypothetical protein